MNYTKDELLRALITNICKTEQLPDKKYPNSFYGKFVPLFEKIIERKDDVPSLEYIIGRYKFEPFETKLKINDILERLDAQYLHEKVGEMFEAYMDERKKNNNCVEVISIVDTMAAELKRVTMVTGGASTIDISSEKERMLEAYKKLQEAGPPVRSGLDKLDEVTPIRRGELVIVMGGTGGGKSILLNKMFCTNIEDENAALQFSLELPLVQVQNRMLAGLRKFPYQALKQGKVQIEEYEKALNEIRSHAYISTRQNVRGRINADTIEHHIDKIKSSGVDLKVVYLDYYSLFDVDTSWDAGESFTGRLKQIALQHDVAIVLAAQVDTESLKGGGMPQLHSAARNKGIVNDADVVIGLLGQAVAGHRVMRVDYEVLKSRDGGFPKFSYEIDVNKGEWRLYEG